MRKIKTYDTFNEALGDTKWDILKTKIALFPLIPILLPIVSNIRIW